MSQRICIIGAGPSGLSTLYHFLKLEEAGQNLPEIVCYEKQSDWCGLWNYTWRTGVDEYGEPIHNSMYRHLWSNGSKEALEFPDYTFEDHFGKVTSSFPPRLALRDYLVGRFSRLNIRRFIRFTHVVKRLVYNSDTDEFVLDVKDLKNNNLIMNEKFTHVVVCSGHFSDPYVPEFPGMDSFPGRVLHAHDVRDVREFSGKKLLIVGSSYSAEDIGLQCHKFGAKQVFISWRTKPMGFKWPKGIEERELLIKVDDKKVHFKDGSSEEVDAIILCTGYVHNFSYLEDKLRLVTPNNLYPVNLYKGILWMRGGNKKLFYVGAQDQYYTFTMFDIQGLWVAQVSLGLKKLPDEDEMEKDIAKWLESLATLKNAHDDIDYQTDYMHDLCKETGFKTNLSAAEIFHEWEHHKNENILTYRDRCFKSLFTGNLAPPNKKTFLESMNDSVEDYIS